MTNTELAQLLAELDPVAHDGVWVFTRVDDDPGNVPAAVTVREAEGLTLVVEQGEADRRGLAYEQRMGWITLQVHSSLAAVGLTAAVSTALAGRGISANVVAGYHHDHLFVPYVRLEDALDVLRALTARR